VLPLAAVEGNAEEPQRAKLVVWKRADKGMAESHADVTDDSTSLEHPNAHVGMTFELREPLSGVINVVTPCSACVRACQSVSLTGALRCGRHKVRTMQWNNQSEETALRISHRYSLEDIMFHSTRTKSSQVCPRL